MSRELLQQALNALLISAPLGHAMEDYEYRHRLIKDIEAELAKPEPVQVRPHEFIAMAGKQANMIGTPVVWAEYPTRPERVFVVHDVGCAVNGYGECDCFGGVEE